MGVLRAMTDEAPNVDDIRDTVITQIVEGGYVTAIPLVVLSLYLFVQGYRRLSLITAIAGAAIGYLSASTLYPYALDLGPVSYTHLTLPTICSV